MGISVSVATKPHYEVALAIDNDIGDTKVVGQADVISVVSLGQSTNELIIVSSVTLMEPNQVKEPIAPKSLNYLTINNKLKLPEASMPKQIHIWNCSIRQCFWDSRNLV